MSEKSETAGEWQIGSCPDEVSSSSQKMVAISEAKEYSLSQDTYTWVKEHCNEVASPQDSSGSDSVSDTTAPVLKSLGVEFAAYNTTTGKAGDFLFTNDALRDHLKGFFEFGALVNAGEKKILPNLEYGSLAEGTKITAVDSGFVVNVVQKPGASDYTVHVLPSENSSWEIAYDHITDPQVERGQTISAGDVIGQVAQENSGLFRTELQIQKTVNGVTEYVCPLTLLDPAIKATVIEQVSTLQKDWEAFAGRELYDQDKQPIAGCNYETLTDAKMAELVQ